MTREVTVTGYGVRTAFGEGAEALRRGVFAGVPAFRPTTRFDTRPYRTAVAAAAPDEVEVVDAGDSVEGWALRDALGRCGGAALAMAGLGVGVEAAVILGVAGDHRSVTRYWLGAGDFVPGESSYVGRGSVVAGRAVPRAPEGARLADAVPARLADLLAGELGLAGSRVTFTNACVASAAAIIHACRLISSGRIDVAVCAGGYLVEEETFGKFDSGRALSRDGMVRPFSAERTGLLLGDGVAAVVLESAEHARRRGARPLASVIGWGAATDAHHIAQPHPQGAGLARAAQQALRRAGDPDGASLDYVNAHGTGTKYNDGAETRGLRAAFPKHAESIPVSSTKSTTGHLLEAAGVVEFVITMLALLDGVLPPTAGYGSPDPECDLDYVPNDPRPADVRRALTINAAFGGANTALVLERP
ncbi:beta-ketoacyl-[acyl-carrier-protein] synthase family protein [Streptomyces turgidiscabies]|uniref:Putative beta-ketoacyl-acyl-carrier-protein synthase II n=3 Tax=Streptomyces TaxID=1883 RepID=L7FEV9_STRT8|nr:beta-ketoacyl-[acyl-carrier-protein] synthase family protein [Streptomyces turgidiscabies]ELP69857.1 putative beta-ketoacyl-acyl-carrier-protein synthase II [Streptomyces turgidiscabies Car8]MDX3492346.1 beta-ketoacyl-[acyl-carrier-protein] synthase family protein [Streptomyces turgidiscabies]BAP59911.1 putative ketosynthase [Streptomyces turgidiscabies]GAQ69361.1 3-oxoacyl-[acyl-carrier-protein] synthase 2 [Streptomyces turgidiscabies]